MHVPGAEAVGLHVVLFLFGFRATHDICSHVSVNPAAIAN